MRWSAEHKEKTREQILKVSSQAYREKGFEGVSLADIMNSVGLTHGGFYAHFRSKDDLILETLKYSFNEAHKRISDRAIDESPSAPLESLLQQYLSPAHRDNAKFGCTVAALGSDIGRLDPATRKEISSKIDEWIDSYRALAGGDRALLMVCAMAGAMQISRMYSDQKKSDEFLETVRNLLGKYIEERV